MNDRLKQVALFMVAVAVAAPQYWRTTQAHSASLSASLKTSSLVNENTTAPIERSQFISSSLTDFSHAATLTELGNGDLLALWFSGSREGADDVQITQARFDYAQQRWLAATPFLTREQIIEQQQLYTGKLGNPVIATAPDGRVWFFVVAATYFGWGSSTINVMTSDDNGLTWSPLKRLQITPFFNLSSLVRNAPLFFDDGSVGLPIYRESVGKFPQWLRIDRDLRIVDQVRANDGRHSLQPAVVAFDAQQLTMLMRSANSKQKRVLVAHSNDAGSSWSQEEAAPIANPNSGLSAVAFDQHSMLVALNDVEKGRHQLSLYRVSKNASDWQKLRVVESTVVAGDKLKLPYHDLLPAFQQTVERNRSDNPQLDLDQYLANIEANNDRLCASQKGCEFYYDYPYLYRDSHDQFHLVYSWNKSFVKHIVFNRAALEIAP